MFDLSMVPFWTDISKYAYVHCRSQPAAQGLEDVPLMPMAGVIRTIRPGSISKAWVMEPRVAPARRSPSEDTINATRPRVKTDLL